MPFRPAHEELPLTPLDFEVLLALADRPLHGYAVLREVLARTQPVSPLRTGTLYRALARLERDGLIGRADPADTPPDRARETQVRRTWRLTPHGRRTAQAEAERLAGQVMAARARGLLPGPRR
ncbi:MAG: helix-turn-helix transcriptional regulator [Vicinamibacterales bacterium]